MPYNRITGKATGGGSTGRPILRGHTSPRKIHRYTDEERQWVIAKIAERPDLTDRDISRLFGRHHEIGMMDSTVRSIRKTSKGAQ